LKIAVITVSDRASRGDYADLSGPAIAEVISRFQGSAEIAREIVPDEEDAILGAFERAAGADWVITSGGTGPSPRDRTPEATRAWIDRELPGLAETLRSASMKETPYAAFSRALAGMRGKQFVVNFPGSPAAAELCAGILAPLLEHGAAMARGEGH
jgi:molybdopterin adenylyltransferase